MKENYDLCVTCLFSFEKEKHIKMARSFRDIGLLNIKDKKICLNALICKKDLQEFKKLNFNYDVNIFEFDSDNISNKIHNYYLNNLKSISENTRWHIQVDDDSSTDVSGLIDILDKIYDYNIPMNLISSNLSDIWNGIREFFQKDEFYKTLNQVKDSLFSPIFWLHEWEVSIQSSAALKLFAKEKKCIELFKLLSQKHDMPSDHCLAAASLICKIPVLGCKFVHFGNLFEDFSLNGGNFYHIHYLNDENHKKLLNIDILNRYFINKPLKFSGETVHGIQNYSNNFILGDDNLIHGYRHDNEYSWEVKNNNLIIYKKNKDVGATFTLSRDLLNKKTLVGQFLHYNVKHSCILKIKD